ncbi:hypothetical protein JOD82_002259 [Paenibacillus sp. 1182]|nr:hypothetical protein [Paenibacillus sp. 1182]
MIKSWIKDIPGDLFAIVLGLGVAYTISLFF